MSPVDLVYANRFNPAQLAMRQAPFHEPLHGPVHRFPTGLKDGRRLAPAQTPRPAGKKPHHRRRQRPLADAPRNMLNHHPVLNTLHPPRRVTEADRYPPQRYKIPLAFRQTVIARSSKTALRAARPHPTVRCHGNLDQRCISAHRAHAYVLVDESDKALHPIQDGLKLYLNSCSPFCSISPLPRKQQTKRSVRRTAISSLRKYQNLHSPQSSQGRGKKWKSRSPSGIYKRGGKVPLLDFSMERHLPPPFSPTNSAIAVKFQEVVHSI